MPKQKRVKRLEIRLTPEELKWAQTKARDLDMTLSHLFRYQTLSPQNLQPMGINLCKNLADLSLQLKPISLAIEQGLWTGEQKQSVAQLKEILETTLTLLQQVQWQQMNLKFINHSLKNNEYFEDELEVI